MRCFPAGIGLSFGAYVPDIPVIDYDNTAEAQLRKLLIEDTLINMLVGARVYPNIIPPKSSMPAITYQQISGPRGHHMQGSDGMPKARFQINCWSDSYAGSKQVSDVVRMVLDGYKDEDITKTLAVILLDNEGDIMEVIAGEDKLTRFNKRFDFMVWFRE